MACSFDNLSSATSPNRMLSLITLSSPRFPTIVRLVKDSPVPRSPIRVCSLEDLGEANSSTDTSNDTLFCFEVKSGSWRVVSGFVLSNKVLVGTEWFVFWFVHVPLVLVWDSMLLFSPISWWFLSTVVDPNEPNVCWLPISRCLSKVKDLVALVL